LLRFCIARHPCLSQSGGLGYKSVGRAIRSAVSFLFFNCIATSYAQRGSSNQIKSRRRIPAGSFSETERLLAEIACKYGTTEPQFCNTELKGFVLKLKGRAPQPNGGVVQPEGAASRLKGAASQPHGLVSQLNGCASQPHGSGVRLHGCGMRLNGSASQPFGSGLRLKLPRRSSFVFALKKLSPQIIQWHPAGARFQTRAKLLCCLRQHTTRTRQQTRASWGGNKL
jgi:hypothetical protein